MAQRGKIEKENGRYEFPYMKPPQKSGWQTFRDFCFDPKNGTVMGRGGKNWAQLLLFYLIFYTILAALFAISMQGLLATIDEKQPKWQQDNGLIGNNPGLGFRPISNRTEEGSLIWFNSRNATSIRKWVELTQEFLKPYLDPNEGKNNVHCDSTKYPGAGQVCDVDPKAFGPCGPDHEFGYNSSSPCVFIKINKIFGWEPQYYDDVNNLPGEMPPQLVQQIQNEPDKRQIWVSCVGEHPADREHVSKFNYYPKGFKSFYYPYMNTAGYLSPLVAVQVIQPKPNVLVNIECRAWAKNIKYRGGNQQREGSVHFEMMRDA